MKFCLDYLLWLVFFVVLLGIRLWKCQHAPKMLRLDRTTQGTTALFFFNIYAYDVVESRYSRRIKAIFLMSLTPCLSDLGLTKGNAHAINRLQ